MDISPHARTVVFRPIRRLAVFQRKLLYAVAYVLRASGAFPQLPGSAAVSARRPRGSALRLRLRRVVIYAPFGFGPVVSATALGLGDRFQGSTSRFQNADILPKHRHSVNRDTANFCRFRNRREIVSVCRMRRRGISRLDNIPMPALIHGDSPCATWGQSPCAVRISFHDFIRFHMSFRFEVRVVGGWVEIISYHHHDLS